MKSKPNPKRNEVLTGVLNALNQVFIKDVKYVPKDMPQLSTLHKIRILHNSLQHTKYNAPYHLTLAVDTAKPYSDYGHSV